MNFLPWAKLDRRLILGPVHIVPWDQMRSTLQTDVMQFLDRYFSRYVMNDGRPVDDLAIAYLGEDPIAHLSADDRAVIQRSVDALVFGTVTRQIRSRIRSGNAGFGVPHSERFQLMTQMFEDFGDGIVVQSGGVSHWWTINDIHFCIPWCVGGDFYDTNDEVMTAVAAFVHEPSAIANRVARAIEWFRLAHTGNDDTSELSRVIMMATAFEILLEPNDPFQKRKLMTQAVH